MWEVGVRLLTTLVALVAPSAIYSAVPLWSYRVRHENFLTWNEQFLWIASGLASAAAVTVLLRLGRPRPWRQTALIAAVAAVLPAAALGALIMTEVVFVAREDFVPLYALLASAACTGVSAALARLPGRWALVVLAAAVATVAALHFWQYDLTRAADEGDTARVRLLLSVFPEHRAKSAALYLAAWCGHVDTVRVLLEHGAQVGYHEYRSGWTPLHAACSGGGRGAALRHLAAVREALVDWGADVDALDARGRTPLFYAVTQSADTVRFLLNLGTDPSARDFAGATPLHEAVQHGQNATFVIEWLLAYGADLADTDDRGRTVLHYLADNPYYFSERMLNFLLAHGLDINARDQDGATPLHLAVGRGINDNPSAASAYGNLDGVRAMLAKGADPAARDNAGRTPLHYFAAYNLGNLDILNLLITSGADPAAKDNEGKTPLNLAVEADSAGVIRALRRYEPGHDDRRRKWQDGPRLLPEGTPEHAWGKRCQDPFSVNSSLSRE
jgi:ankyrin repeat protein